ncbi:MAG: signal peptidase I, partial [Candidatus Coatesbacteria bacterium]|nr:signal peptidase I [Candidatus Coatesbacteria bacterium]
MADLDHRLADGILELWKSSGKCSVLKTAGLSMIPTLEPGDEIVVQHINVNEIKPGDLVTFKVGPEVVTHRVLKRIETDGNLSFLQKGDRGPRSFPLPACSVIGKVVEIRPMSGKHTISV